MTEQAILYTRVSTLEQSSNGVSLDLQEERLRAYCTMHQLEVGCVIREEGISGTLPLSDRPGGMELLKLVASRQVRHVVALKLDRLFRNTADCLTITASWDKAGIGLHLIDLGGSSIDTSTAMGRMFLTMAAGFAELERNLIVERITAAKRYKKARHQVYCGTTPLGYIREGKQLIANANEMKIVKFVQSQRKAGWSLRQIAADLNRRGIRTKHGRLFAAQTVKDIAEHSLYQGVE